MCIEFMHILCVKIFIILIYLNYNEINMSINTIEYIE